LVRRPTLVALAAGVLGSTALGIGYGQTHGAARDRIFESARATPRRSVAIILGALVYRDGRLSDTVQDRVECGLELYRTGRVQRLLISGDHGRSGYDEVSTMGAVLIARGVPAERVFLDHAGFRTLDTMHRAHAVFGVTDAVICTQRFHLPRSLYLASAFGMDAVGLVADRRRYRGELYNTVRESVARTVAVFDRALGREAAVLGSPISLTGDARVTHDRSLIKSAHP
jgi:SanA protein